MRSMTAYGRSQIETARGRWVVEVHSVNRKMLDIGVQMPRELLVFDLDVRKKIHERVQRGQVTVRIHLQSDDEEAPFEALRSLKKRWEGLAQKLGFEKKAVTFEFLAGRFEAAAAPKDEKGFKSDLEKALSLALDAFIAMREKEGAALLKDFKARIASIRKDLQKIEEKAPLLAKKYEEKLKEKLKDFSDERLMREVILYAEKADISEEVTRLHSHLEQFEALFAAKEPSIGRTLDFLTQEMGREINTLGAKAGDSGISKLAIGIKSEIEKIREQVQNIE